MTEPNIEAIKAQVPTNDVIAGIHQAMAIGVPSKPEDRATFFIPSDTVDPGEDEEGVPYNPDVRPTSTPDKVVVPCALDYVDGTELASNFGVVQASKVVITLLDPDYQKVKGFDFVVVAGNRYYYRKTEPPVALGNLDVWTVHVQAEDQT